MKSSLDRPKTDAAASRLVVRRHRHSFIPCSKGAILYKPKMVRIATRNSSLRSVTTIIALARDFGPETRPGPVHRSSLAIKMVILVLVFIL